MNDPIARGDLWHLLVHEFRAFRLQNGRETEFFPEFMRCTEYDEFAAQMRQRAVKTKTLTAQKGANVGTIKPYDISGIWAADKSKMDPDG